MENLSKMYEDYVERLESIIYDHIAIKLATYRGFSESLKKDFKKTITNFPLLHFMVESLQVDSVLTISKLTEDNKNGKTIINFINFTSTNIKTICKKYPTLSIQVCKDNMMELDNIKGQLRRIKTQRNKYYAHSDNEYFFKPNKLLDDFPNTFDDLVDITIALQHIISLHGNLINGKMRVCMSEFAYINTFKTIELLKVASDEWNKKNRS